MIESWFDKKYNYTLAMILGVIATMSIAPFYMFIALFIAFSGFYIILSEMQNAKQAFFCGWFFFFGYFTTGLYWLCIPLIVQSKIFWALIPFVIIAIPACLSLLFAAAATIHYILHYKKLLGLIVFSLSFTIAGMLLENILPWNLFAYSWSFSTEMLQIASLFGIHGLGFLAIFCSTVIGVCIRDKSTFSCIIVLLILVSMFIYGNNRLSKNHEQYNNEIALRIVQGNTKNYWDQSEEKEYDTFQTYLRLTSKYGLNSRTHVVWSETSLPSLTDKNNDSIQNYLKFTIPKFLITGGTRFENNKFYNTLFTINDNGEIIDYYDKHHLVPFGEFIPSILQHIIPRAIVSRFNYSPGTNKEKVISLNNQIPFIPLICYESIFSNEITHRVTKGQWIVNITNDGWFGISSQPYQHLEMSRMRSVEYGLPTIRAANTGISALIDAYGRIIYALPIMTEGIIDSYLPSHISEGTIYSKYFSKFITIPLATLIMLILVLIRIILVFIKADNF